MIDINDFFDLAKRFEVDDTIKDIIPDYEYLYHYTSAKGLEGILSNKNIRFTAAEYLNDKSEGKYIKELILEVLESDEYSDIREEVTKIIKDGAFLDENEQNPQMDKIILNHMGMSRRNNLYYICCFSLNPDSLSMWQCYTKNSRADGYCIKFDTKVLVNNIVKSKNKAYITDNRTRETVEFMLKPYIFYVIYNKTVQEGIIKKILNKYKDNNKKMMNEIFAMFEINDLARFFQILGYFFKHPAFKEESEVRIVFEIPNFKDMFDIKYINFRESNGVFIPYLELNFVDDDLSKENVSYENCAIKGVKLSPTLNDSSYEFAIKMFLNKCGFWYRDKTDVSISNIPFRII